MSTQLSASPINAPTFTRRRSRTATVALWVAQILLASMFLLTGSLKLTGNPQMVELFNALGIGQWFRYLTGAIEVGAAVALLIPSFAVYGALLLIPTMLGAVVTHLFLVGGSPAPATVLLIGLVAVTWARRNELRGVLRAITLNRMPELEASTDQPKAANKSALAATIVATLVGFTTIAIAQESTWHEVSVQATGTFTKNSEANGVTQRTTDSAGLLAGYRFHFNRWVAAEGNYGYTRNTQQNFTVGGPFDIRANTHQALGALVMKLPAAPRVEPFVLAGAGALLFDPRVEIGTLGGAQRQTKPAFVYGGGANINLMTHIALRIEYRGLVYERPDFGLPLLQSDVRAHTAQPSVGFSVRF